MPDASLALGGDRHYHRAGSTGAIVATAERIWQHALKTLRFIGVLDLKVR